MISAGRLLAAEVILLLTLALTGGVPVTVAAAGSVAPSSAPRVNWVNRPFAGAVGADGTTLLLHKVTVVSASGERTRTLGYLMYGADRRLVRKALLARSVSNVGDGAEVMARPGGFVVTRNRGEQFDITLDGRVHRVKRVWRRTALKAGDVLVQSDGWAYRPDGRLLVRLRRVAGGEIHHVDGQGRYWVLGRPEGGQDVLWSSVDGAAWTKQFVGLFSDDNDCTCDRYRGPLGRGGVIVVGGAPLQHVSLDYGQTWTTYDLTGTEPYASIVDIRYAQTSALSDGRIVTGYLSSQGLANDATNTTFTPITRNHPAMWASGLSSALIFRPGEVSADGGTTWIRRRKS